MWSILTAEIWINRGVPYRAGKAVSEPRRMFLSAPQKDVCYRRR